MQPIVGAEQTTGPNTIRQRTPLPPAPATRTEEKDVVKCI